MRPGSPKALLRALRVPACLITGTANVRYLAGFPTEGIILALPKRFLLFVSALERETADHAVSRGMRVFALSDLPGVLSEVLCCGFEADDVTIERKSRWKRKIPNTKFIPFAGILDEFRRQKSPEELRCIRRAERITMEILRRIPGALRSTTTEEQLARKMQMWALELGAEGMAFDPIVAFGTHTSIPHHRPTSRTLQRSHLVQIDVGAKFRGYCSDRSEVFFTAKPTKLQAKIYATLCEARDRAMEAAKPGVTTHTLDKIARDILAREGVEEEFCHGLGHGVGLEIHEGITLSQKRPAEELLKHEVITIEPGVYFPGKFGMRVESMVYVS